jgi:hypothetical protein
MPSTPALRWRRAARRRGCWLAGLLGALALRSWNLLPLPLWSCPLRQLTGVPCPTCFLTRSVLATLRGDLPGAMRYHILGPPLVVGAVWLLAQQLLLGKEPSPARSMPWVAGVAVTAVAYWLIRLAQPGLWPL